MPIKKKRLKRFKKIKKPRVINKDTIGTSKLELYFHAFLVSIGIEVETQHQIGWKFYDFKVKGKNILIELDGDYWHGNPATLTKPLSAMQRRAVVNDKKKDFLAKEHGYKLIRVWESDFNKNRPMVKLKLLEQINTNI